MEQVAALAERIKTLKSIAASMREGAFHTNLIPEIDKILALPDDLSVASVGEREAIARQVREYEQTFDRLGYTLLDQLMPTIGVSPVFRIVQAADAFRRSLRSKVGQTFEVDGRTERFDQRHFDVVTRTSMSIGTPPVTDGMRSLIAGLVFGKDVDKLYDYAETLGCDAEVVRDLVGAFRALIDGSLHYNTAAEEAEFLAEAADFTNFEGGRILNRVVITESPDRVVELIRHHVFDKLGPGEQTAVRIVPGVDSIDWDLVARMQAEPNHVFVVKVTRIPYWLFQPTSGDNAWRSVLGRLILIDASDRARMSNTTVVHTLFPHVARTLRNVQTSFAGRPANTQLLLRRILERYAPSALTSVREALDARLGTLEGEGVREFSVEQVRRLEWRRDALFDYLALKKLRRMVAFLEEVASGGDDGRRALGEGMRERVADLWMRYFYAGLPADRYRAAVLPGGGRGALTIAGDYHRHRVRDLVAEFARDSLPTCRARLEDIKRTLEIPHGSTDEILAAMKQSQLRAQSPTEGLTDKPHARLRDHIPRRVLYGAVDAARRVTDTTQRGLDRVTYGNLTGGVAAFVKHRMSKMGFGALHGRLEDVVGGPIRRYDQNLRQMLLPLQDAVRAVRKTTEDIKGGIDPVAVGEIEAMLAAIEQGAFYPTLILPELSWTYGDVFPEKYYPSKWTVRLPLNDRYEMDPMALLGYLERLRYMLRHFPEVFDLCCRTMLLVINSPHNPTGVVYRRETVLRLLQIAGEYGLTVVDDNSYHKLVTSACKAREGEDCVAQLYEKHRGRLPSDLRIITVSATTKGLQGAGDRTGILVSNVDEVVRFAESRASDPHLMSMYMTQLKLESGVAVKRWTRELEDLAADLLKPGAQETPAQRMERLLEAELARVADEPFPVALFDLLLAGYDELLRLQQRGAVVTDLSRYVSRLVSRVKRLRPERALRADVEKRIEQVRAARKRVMPDAEEIMPEGAFYYCFRISPRGDEQGIQEFLQALCRYRKVDVTYAGHGFVRLSLGGAIRGDDASYERFGRVVEVYLGLLARYFEAFEKTGRDTTKLEEIFRKPGEPLLDGVMRDLGPLIGLHAGEGGHRAGEPVTRAERGIVYCIEEGRSVTDKVFVEYRICANPAELMASPAFRVVYRRLLRKVYRKHPALVDLTFPQVENQYGPHACLRAYHDRQLIDDLFRKLVRDMYELWHGGSTVKVLSAKLETGRHGEKVAALHGANRRLNELINELMHAFDVPDDAVKDSGTFDIGYELLRGLRAHPALPEYLRNVIERCDFAGATTPLNPSPNAVTGAAKRVADHRYGFIRRDGDRPGMAPGANPSLEHFRARLAGFAATSDLGGYVCKAVQVGPFKLLLVIHKSCFHLLSDEMRLFPQIEEVQTRSNLDGLRWDGVLLYGIPAKAMGDGYKTGYVLDRGDDGRLLPLAWVAREDATDYVGFLKKSLLTLHNELVKALGGMPVHGAMITITFKNGLRKTLVFSADSGTGKSETITAMMEQMIAGTGRASEVRRVDILASDMLSLWRGEDDQIYAFGTEVGDFLRTNDITESWKAHFGDLLMRGSYSNIEHPKNARVTIPGICSVQNVLAPTRVNGFFYINNYEAVRGRSVELSDDPNHVLKHTLVRGLRKNKGTSGDQPSLRAGLELAGETDLVVRFRHAIDELVDWQERMVAGKAVTCLCFRDGSGDVFAARELVTQAFKGRAFRVEGEADRIGSIEYDVLENLFWACCRSGRRLVLDRRIADQVYEPLTSTFCGNPFVDPEGMDRTLEVFARTMLKAKVHTGVIRTQLARAGYEFAGPARAAQDIIAFLLEDEEVNARFQRNKGKVNAAMQATYGGVLEAGSNLPVELEGYNLLLLEEHESRHVAFRGLQDEPFVLSTPFYRLDASRDDAARMFAPAIAMPEAVEVIRDICRNADYDADFSELEVDLTRYEPIGWWNNVEELTWQVLLLHGVIGLGSSESEVARFPMEVRKARHIAEMLRKQRPSRMGASVRRPSIFPWGRGAETAARNGWHGRCPPETAAPDGGLGPGHSDSPGHGGGHERF
jgi:hypothetical protein